MRWLRGVLGGAASDDATAGLDPGLQTLLDEHLLPAFDRQLAFAEIVGDRDWDLDQGAGELRLGDDLVLPAQILGTVSEATATWRWSWANSSVDEALSHQAREALRIGGDRDLAVLTEPDLDMARIADGHVLALAVAGLLDADAYYRCAYDGGEAFVLLAIPQVREATSAPANERAVNVISQALFGLTVPITKAAIAAYLRGLSLPATESSREVRIDDDTATRFLFDKAGRLTGIEATRVGDDAPAEVQPPPQGTPLDEWADPAIETAPGWRDAAGDSPIDMLRRYQGERQAWEIRASKAGDKHWPEMLARLEALHAAVSTPRPLEARDTSYGVPPTRDPKHTRVVTVTRSSPGRTTIRLEEDFSEGLFQDIEVIALLHDGHWRLDDRIAIYKDERIPGLL